MSKLFSFRTLATLVLAAAASGCGTVTPMGLVAASKLDPLNTPPSEFVVAVGVPQELRLSDGDAELRIAFQGGTAASTLRLEEVAPLQLTPSDGSGPRAETPDETVYIARLAPADAARIAAVQRDIRALRADGADGTGSLNIRVVGGCFVGAAPASIAVSTWIQTDPSDGFVLLTRQQDITRALGVRDAETLRALLSPCTE